jgi:Glyoxalase-like domain
MISAADDGRAMALKLGNIAFDCDDVLKVATFWSTVLERPLDRGSNEYFASIGGADGDRVEPAWYFTKVPEPKQAKNRVDACGSPAAHAIAAGHSASGKCLTSPGVIHPNNAVMCGSSTRCR